MPLDELIEEQYVLAVKGRNAANTTDKKLSRAYWQGAIEVLEDIMHNARPGSFWALDVCRRHNLINHFANEINSKRGNK
jgi:hypothetical protein